MTWNQVYAVSGDCDITMQSSQRNPNLDTFRIMYQIMTDSCSIVHEQNSMHKGLTGDGFVAEHYSQCIF